MNPSPFSLLRSSTLMNMPRVTSNTSPLSACDDEEPEKSNFFAGQGSQLSTSVLVPLGGLSKSLTFNPSPIPGDFSPVARVPSEILIKVFKHVTATRDLLHCTRVSRQWCECAIELLWKDPYFFEYDIMVKMGRILAAPRQTFTYAQFIRHLDVSYLGPEDDVLLQFRHCDNIEYLNLAGCDWVPEELLIRVFARLQNLTIIDLTNCLQITDDLLIHLAHTTKQLEDINLNSCAKVTDEGILALAGGCPGLRCVEIRHLFLVTDLVVTGLAKSCPLLEKIDLSFCPLVTDLGVRSLWQHSTHMQLLCLSSCPALTSKAFPAPPPRSGQKGRSDIDPFSPSSPASKIDTGDVLLPLILDHIQLLNLSGCSLITDNAIEGIISHAPSIQHLSLTDCPQLTGRAVEAICKLGDSLQRLDLGYSNKITDSSIQLLARSCTKLLLLHIGSCAQFTLATIRFLLQKLDKLTSLTLSRFPPFQDPGVQEAYGKAYRKVYGPNPARGESPEGLMSEGTFSSSEIPQLRDFLTELQGEAIAGPSQISVIPGA